MKRMFATASCAVAVTAFSACGSSRPTVAPVMAHYLGAGSLTFVANGPSTALGVDNTDIYASTASGRVRNVTSTAAAETDAAWSTDGRHVVFIRQWTTGHANGEIAVHAGIYTWSPGHGGPQRIASCSDACSQGDFAWSPDDQRIAFVSDAHAYGISAIEVMNADGAGVHTICDSERCGDGLTKPVWSPDGSKLVFSNERSIGTEQFGGSPPGPIWIANADGSGLTKLTQPNCVVGDPKRQDCALDTSPAWSPNGRLIAFSRYRDIFTPATSGRPPTHAITARIELMRTDGSHARSLYRCTGDSCGQTLPLVWASDGKSVAYGPVRADDSSVRLTTLTGKTTTIRTCVPSRCLHARSLAWSPNGKQLAFISGRAVWAIGRDGSGLHRVGGATCCLAWLQHLSSSGAKPPPPLPRGYFHLSGSIVSGPAVNDRRPFPLLSFGAAGTRQTHLPTLRGTEPVFSPNGREIAFTGTVAGDFRSHILVADRKGKNARVLTDVSALDPAWSPDGRTIAFTRDGGNGPRDHWIALVSVTGGPIRDVTTAGWQPSWSPGGKELVFRRRVAGGGDALFTVRPDGHGLRRLTELPGNQGSTAWSPGGTEIAFEWWTAAGTGLYLIRPDGTHLRRATSATLPAGKPAWSPDGRYLVVMRDDYQARSTPVIVIDARSGAISTVATVPGAFTDPSWASR